MREFSFEKLKFWNDLRVFIKTIYELTKEFPDVERFGLVSQLRRACVSVSSNLAEGSSRTSSKDQAHFTQLSYSSLMEFLSQIIVSKDLNYLTQDEYQQLRIQIENLSRPLNALRNSQLKKLNS